MQVLTSTLDFAAYLAAVPRASARVLLLDYDGTLAPFHPDPAQAVPYPGVTALLREVMAAGTRLVLVTGRPAEELPPLVGLDPAPEIWGGHGWEQRLPDGRIERAAPSPEERAVLATTPADAAVAYLGDDLTDEDAFVAVRSRGVAVLVRPRCRPTVADVWLRPPDELLEFLRHWRGGGS